LGLSLKETALALHQFSGVGRRFDILGEANEITIINDYAHHPTEIRATLSAARNRFPGKRIWAVWQPHTYTRTLALEKEFLSAFEDADQILVTKIYAAREQNELVSAKQVADAMPGLKTRFVPTFENAESILLNELKPGDVLIVLSAGDADQISSTVFIGLRGRK
jgi:UDP-N-acetylmuramate--alanine ligase